MPHSDPISVTLSPTTGFCVKSAVLTDGGYDVPHTEEGPARRLAAPKGGKVFVNICFDDNVPPPPEGSEETIQRAISGEKASAEDEEWFVPVVVSHAREDKDKAGKPSLVFDCVFHSTVKSRILKDSQYKLFIIELALQRIEEKSSLPLSRTLGMPNIRSKGALLPRNVKIPPKLYPVGHPLRLLAEPLSAPTSKKLIEEIEAPPKGILKKVSDRNIVERPPTPIELDHSLETPAWTWSCDDSGFQIKIQVPKLNHSSIHEATLDVEPRRVMLQIASQYSLDINLTLSDADLQKSPKTPVAAVNAAQAMALKRNPRQFDVDSARAEWRVADSLLIVFA